MYIFSLKFFQNILEKDEKLLLAVNNTDEDIKIIKGDLVFSLNGLYQFLLNDKQIPKDASFVEFKKSLYRDGLINQDLKAYEGVIEVYQSASKIDSNIYILKRSKP